MLKEYETRMQFNKIREYSHRIVFDITTFTGDYQVIARDTDEVSIRKFDEEGMLGGEGNFSWKWESLKNKKHKEREAFYIVLDMILKNLFG